MTDLPQPLIDAYRSEKLAILFGSGLSLAPDVKGNFPRWAQLPHRLLEQAIKQSVWSQGQVDGMRMFFESGYLSLENMLTGLDVLKFALRGNRKYRAALTAIFRPDDATPGDVHQALVDTGVRILVTPNYDDLLERVEGPPRRTAYTWKESAQALDDAQEQRKILFKLHGSAEDDTSVIMTRSEYETATKSESYQRVMSHLLQNYTFLLVGFGINDPLDLDVLFGLNADAFGTAAKTHYALVKDASDIDRGRWLREMNIQVVPYADHNDLPGILRALAKNKPTSNPP